MMIFVTQTSISPTAVPVLIVVSGPSASRIAHPEVAAMPAFKNLRCTEACSEGACRNCGGGSGGGSGCDRYCGRAPVEFNLVERHKFIVAPPRINNIQPKPSADDRGAANKWWQERVTGLVWHLERPFCHPFIIFLAPAKLQVHVLNAVPRAI